MSKMDNLRAMREARYEQAAARAGRSTPKPTMPKPTMPEPQATTSQMSDDVPEQEAALCGHRNMGGRTCTREAGHAAKSHRYS